MSAASASKSLAVTLLPLTEDIIGFFIIESHVLKTTRSFRSSREVEELWDSVVTKVAEVVKIGLKDESDVDTFLTCKDIILSFIQTLEVRVRSQIGVTNFWLICISGLLLRDRTTKIPHHHSIRELFWPSG